MGTLRERLCGQTIIALFVVVALWGGQAGAQTTPAAPASEGMTACAFNAQSSDASERGLAVRAAPNAAAEALGYIPKVEDKPEGSDGETKRSHGFRVVGAKDGWFWIEGADYVNLGSPSSHSDKGWVDSRSVTVRHYRETLKAAPNDAAPDVVYLVAYDAAGASIYAPDKVPVSRVLCCSGPWVEVEIRLPGAKTLTGEPASANETARGWTDRTCADPDPGGQCASRQFDYPWSPLPSGITECGFIAFSNDPDPAGLNVRAEPDRNVRVLGRLPAPIDPRGGIFSGAKVIGYKKGWFLIEEGFNEDPDPRRSKLTVYSGRGWVAANLLTVELFRIKLKFAPNGASADVVNLEDVEGEPPRDASFVRPRRILGCSGDWVHVEVGLSRGAKPLAKTDAPPGAVRGWANGICANETTPCTFDQSVPWPWSPPAPLPPE
jgi:hypothetical protein